MKNPYNDPDTLAAKRRESFFRAGMVILSLLILSAVPLLFTGCDDDEVPDYTVQTDPALYGTWQLSAVNDMPVSGYQVNYMEFDNDGDGEFTGYSNRMPYERDFSYWCSGTYPYYTLNIVYANGESVVMAYRMPDPDTLITTWVQNGETISYTYIRY